MTTKKPQRKIPGTDVIAVTEYRSSDGTVREYALYTEAGDYLGRAYYQPRHWPFTRCYTTTPTRRNDSDRWFTLAEFANAAKARLGIEASA